MAHAQSATPMATWQVQSTHAHEVASRRIQGAQLNPSAVGQPGSVVSKEAVLALAALAAAPEVEATLLAVGRTVAKRELTHLFKLRMARMRRALEKSHEVDRRSHGRSHGGSAETGAGAAGATGGAGATGSAGAAAAAATG